MNAEHLRTFGHHTIIFREGDSGDEMYIIHSGRVRLMKQIQHRFETIGELAAGDFFGELALIEPGTPRSVTAITMDDETTLVALNKAQFEAMIQGNLEIPFKIIRQYAKRLQASDARLEKLMHEQQALDSGIQDILSHVRKQSDEVEDQRLLFGWLQSTDKEQKFALKRPEMLIGRSDASTHFNPSLDLTNLDQHRTVSRKHARIVCLDEGVFLAEEPGVVNGTLLNGHQVEKGKMLPLHHEDRVQFGKLNFQFLLSTKPNIS